MQKNFVRFKVTSSSRDKYCFKDARKYKKNQNLKAHSILKNCLRVFILIYLNCVNRIFAWRTTMWFRQFLHKLGGKNLQNLLDHLLGIYWTSPTRHLAILKFLIGYCPIFDVASKKWPRLAIFWSFLGKAFIFASITEYGHLKGRNTVHGCNLYISVGIVGELLLYLNGLHGNWKPCKMDQRGNIYLTTP